MYNKTYLKEQAYTLDNMRYSIHAFTIYMFNKP